MYKKIFSLLLIVALALLVVSTSSAQTFSDRQLTPNSDLTIEQNLSSQQQTAKTIYVDSSNTSGIEDGTQTNPFNTIIEGIDAASEGDTLLVSRGTYDENPEIYNKTLYLFGGFENSEWTRDIYVHETIIDGGYRSTTIIISNSSTMLDGFTIQHGEHPEQGGGGIGHTDGDPVIRNCIIRENVGGIFLFGGNPQILNCQVIENSSPTAHSAAGLMVNGSDVYIRNTIIARNVGDFDCSYHTHIIPGSKATFVNCTITGNEKEGFGGDGDKIFRNCIRWNNAEEGDLGDIFYSNCPESPPENGNISKNPLFVNEMSGDYHLCLGSPCIDSGDPDIIFNDVDGSRNDMGAYGGPDGESYIYMDNPPVVENVIVEPGVVSKGDDVIINAYIWDAASSVDSVKAEIESPDETVLATINLYDDGLHNDSDAGDSTYGNIWATLADSGRHYYIDIIAVDDNSNSGTYENVVEFDTQEPDTIHVNVNNNSGIEDGTQEHPYNTILEGITALNYGDILLVSKGNYKENVNIPQNKIGVTIKAVDSLQATIKGSVIINADYVHFENFKVESVTGQERGISLVECRNCYIRGNEAFNNTTQGQIIIDGSSSNNTVILNTCYGGCSGICLFQGTHANTITQNTIYENYWEGINLDGTYDNLIEGNCIYDNNNGIRIWNSSINNAHHNLIRNNIIYDNNSFGMRIEYGSFSNSIINNVFYNNQRQGAIYGRECGNDNVFINNVLSNNQYAFNFEDIGTNTIAYNNFWANNTNFSGIDNIIGVDGNIAKNPLFVDPELADFHLLLGSPCIDAGDPDFIYNDLDGTRNDMGAYGGPGGSSYDYLDGPPVIEKPIVIPNLLAPGDTVTISAFVWDGGDNLSSVTAEIESPDETVLQTIELYDDGTHGDGVSGDSTYGNYWQTSTIPMAHVVDLIAIDENGYSTSVDNAAYFTTDTTSLPHQLTSNPNWDTTPSIAQMSDGTICMVWCSDRASYRYLWYKISNDTGTTWSSANQLTSGEVYDYNPSITQAADGKIWVIWERDGNILFKTSTDNCQSWSIDDELITDPSSDWSPAIKSDQAGMLIVVWISRRNNFNIFYKISLDNGKTWTSDKQLTSDSNYKACPSVAISSAGEIYVFWAKYQSGAYDIWCSYSEDKGNSWSTEVQVTSNSGYNLYPRAGFDSSDLFWLILQSDRTGDNNLFFQTSLDGIVWNPAVQFTRFTGYDGSPDLTIIDDRPWVAWSSDRAVNADIWQGILGLTLDTNPPPHLNLLTHEPSLPYPDSSDVITVNAKITDETKVESASLVYSLNEVLQPNLTMYNDGSHNDRLADDNIWGVQIGPYPPRTVINYQIKAQDISGNIILAPQDSHRIEVIPRFVPTSNNLLIADDYGDRYLSYYIDALEARDVDYDIWECYKRDEIDSSTMQHYTDGILIYYSGNNWSPLSKTERKNIGDYLDAGGRLFITGQNIGWYLNLYNPDIDWYEKYLHANFVQNTGSHLLNGVTGDIITDGLSISISGGDGADNQFNNHEIAPILPAVTIFDYQSSLATKYPLISTYSKIIRNNYQINFMDRIDALKIMRSYPSNSNNSSGTGAIRVDTGNYKLVYFAFGFEAINSASDRAFVLKKIIDWLLLPSSIDENNNTTLPTKFFVSQNYPNPFNPKTTIQYGLPESALVKITIYNTLGQKVRTLVNRYQENGYHQIIWDGYNDQGKSIASGIYFYHFESGDFVKIRKMLLLR